jgi:WD domain, G-beta repeat
MSSLVGLMTFLSLASAYADTPRTPLVRMGAGVKPTGVCRLAFAPDGKTIAWAGSGAVCLYDPANAALRRRLNTNASDAKCLAFAPDGKTIAVGAGGSVTLFDANTDEKKAEWQAHSDGVEAVAFSPDGQSLATAGDDDHVGLWEPATGKERSRLELHAKGASVLAFSADGKCLTAGDAAGVTVWRMNDEDERRRLVGRDGRVGFIAFAPDGNSFLWTQGKTIRISEVETWVELARFNGRDMDAACFALSPDGKTLATGGGKTIHLWDLETGAHLLQFRDEKADTAAVLFAPNGKTLASASPDGAVLLWNIKELPRQRLEWLWRELSGNDAADAVHAVRAMKATPAESVAFLRERIRPAPPPASDVARLVADLDNDDFTEREKATTELANRGRKVEAELRQAYEKQPSPEMRFRLANLLAQLKDAPNEETAKVRAVQVLETIGVGEARVFLETLAKGPPDSRVTKEAKASLQRLNATPSP